MSKEYNEVKIFGVKPAHDADAFEVEQDTAADLKATVTQAAKDRTVTNATAANLKAEIHQPATKEEFNVVREVPSDVTRVTQSVNSYGAENTLKTVTAGKTLYVCTLIVSTVNSNAAVQWGMVRVKNAAGTEQYRLWYEYTPPSDGECCPITFNPPLEIPEEWYITVYSADADLEVNGFIDGYEK